MIEVKDGKIIIDIKETLSKNPDGFPSMYIPYYDGLLPKVVNNLADNVKKKVANEVIISLDKFVDAISDCESPIEELMGIALKKREEREGLLPLFISPQWKVETKDKNFRIDFILARVDSITDDGLDEHVKIAIECDGHEFHEKTKEQAQHDKQRDRLLTELGFKVLRFTGSEIYRDADACAAEVYRLARRLLEQHE